MLHPQADKLCNILVRFLFERGNKVVKIEAPAVPGIEHMTESVAKGFLAITFAQCVKEEKTLGAKKSCILRFLLRGVPRNELECAPNRSFTKGRPFDGFAAQGGGKSR